jgi:Asp-tRNA(Asn)/Glu-tRNA(Gln) amidotransferase A subunit family amidase
MPFWTPEGKYLDLIAQDPPPLRIALSHEWGDYRATPHIADQLARAGSFLEGLGHIVDWAKPDVDFRAAYAAQTSAYIMNVGPNVARLSQLRGHNTPPAGIVEPMNIRIWEAGLEVKHTARTEMALAFNRISRGFGAFFEEWDVLLTPISSRTTHLIGEKQLVTLNDTDTAQEWFAKLWGMYPYTPLGNLCGIPGISLPIAEHENGLPLGIHGLAAQAKDGLLLQLAAQVERALGGKWNGGRVPGVHVTRL